MSGPKEKQAMTKSAFIKEVHDAEAMLYHVAKSILKNDADCCDAVQETLLKAYEKLDTLKKEKFFRTRHLYCRILVTTLGTWKTILNSAAIKREKHCQTIPVKY